MTKKRLIIFSVAAVCSLSGLHAEIKVETDGSKPADHIALSYEPSGSVGNTTTFHRGTGEYRRVGQAFAVTDKDFDLTALTWKIWDFDPAVEGKKFSLQVYRLVAVNKAPDMGNDLVLSEEGTLPQTLNPEDYITFTFSKGVKLEKGESYLILFGFEEPTSQDASAKSIGFQRSDDRAESGRLWVYNGENFTADNKSMTFYLRGK